MIWWGIHFSLKTLFVQFSRQFGQFGTLLIFPFIANFCWAPLCYLKGGLSVSKISKNFFVKFPHQFEQYVTLIPPSISSNFFWPPLTIVSLGSNICWLEMEKIKRVLNWPNWRENWTKRVFKEKCIPHHIMHSGSSNKLG